MTRPALSAGPLGPTPEKIGLILQALRQGDTRRAAAAAAGIHSDTLSAWMRKNDVLRMVVEQAESEAEHNHLMVVVRAAVRGDPKASMWWLERRRPKDYGQYMRVDIKAEVKREAERLASELGIDADAAIAEAEKILQGG